MGIINNKVHVIEYSEISKQMAEQTDPKTGKLVFGDSNIAMHAFSVEFLRKVTIFIFFNEN